jgi:acyl dehydratase
VSSSLAGRSYPPTPAYEVSSHKIREFADAIGDDSPVFRDPDAARALGYPAVICPPTFPILLTLPAGMQVVQDPESEMDYSRVVHGDQSFDYVRPLYAGDVVQVVIHVDEIKYAGGNQLVSTRGEVCTTQGELVVTVRSTMVVRGPEPSPSDDQS